MGAELIAEGQPFRHPDDLVALVVAKFGNSAAHAHQILGMPPLISLFSSPRGRKKKVTHDDCPLFLKRSEAGESSHQHLQSNGMKLEIWLDLEVSDQLDLESDWMALEVSGLNLKSSSMVLRWNLMAVELSRRELKQD